MAKIMITNPAHDDITCYLYEYSRPIVKTALKKGNKVKEFTYQDVNKNNIETFINRQNPKFVVFHGHGSKESICGFDSDILIEMGRNDSLLNNKIIHSITCDSASKLGHSAVKKGCKTFIGFEEEFWCPYNPSCISNPKKDISAKCNIEPLMMLTNSIVKMNSVKEAYKKSQDCFKKWLEFCQRSDAPYEVEGVAQFIFWNMINQKVLGDDKAKLS